MNHPLEIRKVIIGAVLAILWVCTFLFIPSTWLIDWTGQALTKGAAVPLTPFKPRVRGSNPRAGTIQALCASDGAIGQVFDFPEAPSATC